MSQNNHRLSRDYVALAKAVASAKSLWALVALVAVLAVVSACAVDADRIAERRAQLQTLCEGAITPQLRALCERYGIDTAPSPDVR